jgi:hypothetical protein
MVDDTGLFRGWIRVFDMPRTTANSKYRVIEVEGFQWTNIVVEDATVEQLRSLMPGFIARAR